MSDYLVRGTGASGRVRAFAAVTKDTVEEARKAHNTSPVVTAALGRLLTAGAMMGAMLKGDDIITIQIRSEGPIEGLTVTADARGNVKGFALEPQVLIGARKSDHKLDVGLAVGHGNLQVIKDLGLKDPYVGNVELVSGEIAEDLTYYFASSEQVPSSVGLGVLMTKDNTVSEAGGFIVQLMPDAGEDVISKLEENLKKINSVTDILAEGKSAEDIIKMLLEGMEPEVYERQSVGFNCDCSVSKVSKVLISTGEKELQSMIDDGKEIEVKCHFCGKAYNFSPEELSALLQAAQQKNKV